jgi:hypothetical protein
MGGPWAETRSSGSGPRERGSGNGRSELRSSAPAGLVERKSANVIDEGLDVDRLEHDRLHHRSIELSEQRRIGSRDDDDLQQQQFLGSDELEYVVAGSIGEKQVENDNESHEESRLPCPRSRLFRRLSAMDAEIRSEKIGTKWHAYLDGRPDIDQTALTEEAARRKVEEMRDGFGVCAAKTKLLGGRTCDRVPGHREFMGKPSEHRSGTVTWIDAMRDGGG